jgi:GTPase Era involved in 16S rRNA processing
MKLRSVLVLVVTPGCCSAWSHQSSSLLTTSAAPHLTWKPSLVLLRATRVPTAAAAGEEGEGYGSSSSSNNSNSNSNKDLDEEDEEEDGPEIFNIEDLGSLSSDPLDAASVASAIASATLVVDDSSSSSSSSSSEPLPTWSGKDGDRTLIDLGAVPETFKAGFVSIVGHPNAGKSTLMNHLVGVPDLCITTNKAQTTRHRIMGVVTGSDFQVVYSDTPGILEPRYKLQEEMMQSVRNALSDADVLLAVVDVANDARQQQQRQQQLASLGEGEGGEGAGEMDPSTMSIEALTKYLADGAGAEDDLLARVLQAATQPVVLALNKADLVDGSRPPKSKRGGGGGGRGAKNRNARRQEAMAAKRAKRAAREAAAARGEAVAAPVAAEEVMAAAAAGEKEGPAAKEDEKEEEENEEEDEPFADPEGVLAAAEARWRELLPAATVVRVSATQGKGCGELLAGLRAHLPTHPPLYPADTLTDKPEKFFASEIVREKILLLYGAEVPYSCEVVIKSFKDDDGSGDGGGGEDGGGAGQRRRRKKGLLRIEAVVYVARDSQKGILIGKQGRDIKRLGTKARAALEEFFDKQVFLDLKVQVSKDWRFKTDVIKRYGYGE